MNGGPLMGKPAKPEAVRKLFVADGHGTDDATGDVLADPVTPDPPGWLSRRGRAVWAYLSPELDQHALLTRRDREAFAMCCEEAAMAQVALLSLRDENNDYRALVTVDTAHKDRMQKSPALVAYLALSKSYMSWCRQFGLTPNARIGLMIGGPSPMKSHEFEDGDIVGFG